MVTVITLFLGGGSRRFLGTWELEDWIHCTEDIVLFPKIAGWGTWGSCVDHCITVAVLRRWPLQCRGLPIPVFLQIPRQLLCQVILSHITCFLCCIFISVQASVIWWANWVVKGGTLGSNSLSPAGWTLACVPCQPESCRPWLCRPVPQPGLWFFKLAEELGFPPFPSTTTTQNFSA